MRSFIFMTAAVLFISSSQLVLADEPPSQDASFQEAMKEFSGKMEEGYQAGMLLPVNVSNTLFLKVTTPPDFILGSSKTHELNPDQRMFMVEFVPKGETVEKWTRIITTQSFVGLGNKAGPLLESILEGLKDAVGEDNVEDPNMYLTTQTDYTEAFMQVTYTNKGMKERLVIKIFSGHYDTAVAQMTYRYDSDGENEADKYEEEFLEGVNLINKEELGDIDPNKEEK